MSNILKIFATATNNGIIDPGNTLAKGNGDDLKNAVIGIINAVVGILALICVVVVIVGGVTYMTSSGDAGKVKKAKDTILYGVIGLIVCVLAFAIVNFVIAKIIGS